MDREVERLVTCSIELLEGIREEQAGKVDGGECVERLDCAIGFLQEAREKGRRLNKAEVLSIVANAVKAIAGVAALISSLQ